MGAALLAQRAVQLEPAEGAWIERIETLRAGLLRSGETIEIADYGAGAPGVSRSDAAMSLGPLAIETVGDVCREYSQSPSWARLLFSMVRSLKPSVSIEMGTCLGISTAYQAAAQELNGAGRIVSLEGAPALAAVARRNLDALGLGHRAVVTVGRFQDSLDPVFFQELGKPDWVFIDGHHDEHATVGYFETVQPHLADRATLVFDDIDWSPGMQRAWRTIVADPRVAVSFDLAKMGVCLLGEGERGRHRLAVRS